LVASLQQLSHALLFGKSAVESDVITQDPAGFLYLYSSRRSPLQLPLDYDFNGTAIQLPTAIQTILTEGTVDASFVAFAKDLEPYGWANASVSVNSPVISLTLYAADDSTPDRAPLEVDSLPTNELVEITLPSKESWKYELCQYWVEETSSWSTDGCSVLSAPVRIHSTLPLYCRFCRNTISTCIFS
jgi:hypothetical protein